MERSFKCCKNKDFLNFCCIECNSIFHPSCMDRSQQAIKLGGYRILCSTACQTKLNDRENEHEVFTKEIESLQKIIRGKDRYLERVKRNSQVFEEEVSDAEKSFVSQLDKLNQRNTLLEDEIRQIRNQEEHMSAELNSAKDEKQQLELKIKELTDLNKNMIITIESLEKDNQAYSKEAKEMQLKLYNIQTENNTKQLSSEADIKELQETRECMLTSIRVLESENKQYYCQIKTLQDEMNQLKELKMTEASKKSNHSNVIEKEERPTTVNDVTDVPESVPEFKKEMKQKKILILCDEAGRGLNKLLREELKKDYLVQCIIKPGASYVDVIADIGRLVKDFTRDDSVIILAGTNEFEQNKIPKIGAIWEKLKCCTHTNILFLAHPAVDKFAISTKIQSFFTNLSLLLTE